MSFIAAVVFVTVSVAGCSSDDTNSTNRSSSQDRPLASSVVSSSPTPSVTTTAVAPPTSTEDPVAAPPEPAEKEIASCATTTLYQAGTTWYTDGTSGWTQYCQDLYYAANPQTEEQVSYADGDVVNEGGGSYSTCQNGDWVYIDPTFDPDSGDGYGPNQQLPPLCVRFPDQYTC
jgi:hypothetical protein